MSIILQISSELVTKKGKIYIAMLFLMTGAVLVQAMAAVIGAPNLICQEIAGNEVPTYNFPYVRRSQWHARLPQYREPLSVPVPYIVIHHSYSPPACYDTISCQQAMRSMQNFHMDDRKWADIGYNFGVGGDGIAYEGRGWDVLGAHSLHFNNFSIGICLIGDWINTVPPLKQLKTTQALIAAGVDMGYIRKDYKLVGHRQVRDTECPGDALYGEIQTWPHYTPYPSSYLDLDKVLELLKAGKI